MDGRRLDLPQSESCAYQDPGYDFPHQGVEINGDWRSAGHGLPALRVILAPSVRFRDWQSDDLDAELLKYEDFGQIRTTACVLNHVDKSVVNLFFLQALHSFEQQLEVRLLIIVSRFDDRSLALLPGPQGLARGRLIG